MSEMLKYIDSLSVSLMTNVWIKSAFTAITAAVSYVCGIKHVQVLFVFVGLIVIDLITKWMAISYENLIDEGAEHDRIGTFDKIIGIPLAFEKELIASKYMRKGFVRKLMSYIILTMAAVAADYVCEKPFFVHLAWLYLGSSEFLSILENMRDGGNAEVGRFLELIKDKVRKRIEI